MTSRRGTGSVFSSIPWCFKSGDNDYRLRSSALETPSYLHWPQLRQIPRYHIVFKLPSGVQRYPPATHHPSAPDRRPALPLTSKGRSRTSGPVDNGEQRSAASSPALQVGSPTARPVDNSERHIAPPLHLRCRSGPAPPDQWTMASSV